MNASKVIITQETRERLNNPVLSPSKKRQLREEMIIESIRKAQSGSRTKQELIAAAGFNVNITSEYGKGHHIITQMVKSGKIFHNNTTAYRKNWVVASDLRVTPSPKAVAKEILPKEQTKLALTEKPPLTTVELVQLAKDFAWRENSDSLRDFIAFTETSLR